jgi:hypothetical protein
MGQTQSCLRSTKLPSEIERRTLRVPVATKLAVLDNGLESSKRTSISWHFGRSTEQIDPANYR